MYGRNCERFLLTIESDVEEGGAFVLDCIEARLALLMQQSFMKCLCLCCSDQPHCACFEVFFDLRSCVCFQSAL